MTTKQEMYDQLFPAIYLKMVEQFLADIKVPDVGGTIFTEPDLDHLIALSEQARMIADIGADTHALGLVDEARTGRTLTGTSNPDERNAIMKRVVGPRFYQMATGQTNPVENAQLQMLLSNFKSLPPHVQHQLMKTTLPVDSLVNMLKHHAAQSPESRTRWVRP